MGIDELSINEISVLAKIASEKSKQKLTPEQKLEIKCNELFTQISKATNNALNGRKCSVYFNICKFNILKGSGVNRTNKPTFNTKVLIPITINGVELPIYVPLGTTPELKSSREETFNNFINLVFKNRDEKMYNLLVDSLTHGKTVERQKPTVNPRVVTMNPKTPGAPRSRKVKKGGYMSDDDIAGDSLTPVAQSPATMSPTPLSPISRKPAPGILRPVSPLGHAIKRSVSPPRVGFSPEPTRIHSRR